MVDSSKPDMLEGSCPSQDMGPLPYTAFAAQCSNNTWRGAVHYWNRCLCRVGQIHGKGPSEHGKGFAVSNSTAKCTRHNTGRQRHFVVCIFQTARPLRRDPKPPGLRHGTRHSAVRRGPRRVNAVRIEPIG